MNPLIIEDREFRLEQIEIGSPFWDLYVRKVVQHKTGESTIEWKIYGYGMTIVTALDVIISCRMAARRKASIEDQEKFPFKLKEYFEAYIKERKETLKAFNISSIDLTKDLIKLQKELKNNGEKRKTNASSGNE